MGRTSVKDIELEIMSVVTPGVTDLDRDADVECLDVSLIIPVVDNEILDIIEIADVDSIVLVTILVHLRCLSSEDLILIKSTKLELNGRSNILDGLELCRILDIPVVTLGQTNVDEESIELIVLIHVDGLDDIRNKSEAA